MLTLLIIFLSLLGYQHKKSVMFCDCEEDAITLVRLQLWPGSVTRPLVAFHVKLVALAETLLLECHCSLKKICDVLNISKSNMLPMWVCSMYLSYMLYLKHIYNIDFVNSEC